MPNKINMRGDWIGVEELKKAPVKKDDWFVDVEASRNLGIVVHSGEHSKIETGTKVYFGNDFERLLIESKEILVMESENVIATVEEIQAEKATTAESTG